MHSHFNMTERNKQMATEKKTYLEIRPLEINRIPIRIVGDTPLLVHAWSAKAKKMILDAQTGKNKTKAKAKKDPFDDFINSMNWLEGHPEISTPEAFAEAVHNGARWGFPVGAIKMAANSAAYRLGWTKSKMELRGAYFLKSADGNMAEIKGSIPTIREDMVRVGMGVADIRYRAEFKEWYMDFELEWSETGILTGEQIINCINAGGFAVGIGEWRPEHDGELGRFHIEANV